LGAPPDVNRYNIKAEGFQAQPIPHASTNSPTEVARGKFTIRIATTLSLSQIQEAHREAENHPSGMIVLKAA
jgi:hypothetical protein